METLSIVMQGAVGPHGTLSDDVLHNILRTRRAFPRAELIVSTWRVSPVADRALTDSLSLRDVILVLSDDPGSLVGTDDAGVHRTNVNRLLRSSLAGLAAVTRPLVIKMRTDTSLSDRRLGALLTQYVVRAQGPTRDPAYRVFRSRVINASWFARDARGSLPFLFHPGDILLAGLAEDVRLFFSAPLATAALFQPSSAPGRWCAWRYVPEQWCWTQAIARVTGQPPWPGNFHHAPDAVAASEQYFLANFVPFSPRALALRWPKYWRRYPLRGLLSTVTHRRWRHQIRAYASGRPQQPYALPIRLLTGLWRAGYSLRVRLLRWPPLRRLAVRLFVHRA